MAKDALFVGHEDDFELLNEIVTMTTPPALLGYLNIGTTELEEILTNIATHPRDLIITGWKIRSRGSFLTDSLVYGPRVASAAVSQQTPALIYSGHPDAKAVAGTEFVDSSKIGLDQLITVLSRLLSSKTSV